MKIKSDSINETIHRKRQGSFENQGWFQINSKKNVEKKHSTQLRILPSWEKALSVGLGLLCIGVVLSTESEISNGVIGLAAIGSQNLMVQLLGLSLGLSGICAQVTPVNSVFRVNTNSSGHQTQQSMALLSNGDHVVTWTSQHEDPMGSIYGQKLRADAKLDGEFLVNLNSAGAQSQSTITGLDNGDFVVGWSEGANNDIIFQRFDNATTSIGSPIIANAQRLGSLGYPDVTSISGGRFACIWDDLDPEEFRGTVRFNNGTLEAPFTIVTSLVSEDVDLSSITARPDGGFVVGYIDNSGFVSALFYDANNLPSTPPFRFDRVRKSTYLTRLSGEKFTIKYINGNLLKINLFNRTHLIGPAISINLNDPTPEDRFSSVGLADGGFVTFISDDMSSRYGIIGNRFSRDGVKLNETIPIYNLTTGDQFHPRALALSDSQIFVTWVEDDGDGNGIFGQIFDVDSGVGSSEMSLGQTSTMTAFSNYMDSVVDLETNQTSIETVSFPVSQSSVNNVLSSKSSSPLSTLRTNIESTNSFETAQSQPYSSSRTSSQNSPTNSEPNESQSASSLIENPFLFTIVYGEFYSIEQSGQTIGTFSFSGGTGQFSNANPNTINLEIDPNYTFQDGDTFTLFNIPEGESFVWEGITTDSECFDAGGEIIQNQSGEDSFQVVFNLKPDSCTIYSGASKLHTLTILTSGGLV